MITVQEIQCLFDKFSFPLVRPAITENQKKVSISIAKTLWLIFVKGADTENNIYAALYSLLNSHERVVAIGSVYFFKMKTAISESEYTSLREYYDVDENFNKLENWIDEV